MFKMFKIKGNSLYPLYLDGQIIICMKVFTFIKLKTDDTVVFSKQGYGQMIKQIVNIIDNKYFVQGTNIESVDSRDFGPISLENINYKVILHFNF